MIPADVLSRLRPTADSATQPTSPAQKLSDVLSDFIPGQRVMAEIQALLPNGTYRAMVAQREITLALPFSAKSGDSLELEIQESDGKLTLAFVGKQSAAAGEGQPQESVASTLSRTGQLIADLLPKGQGKDGQPKPVPLNSAAPLLPTPPQSAAELAPALKQAITQSGMFYESHQAQWAQGMLPTEALLQEPQGKLSQPLPAPAQNPALAPLPGQSPQGETLKSAANEPGQAHQGATAVQQEASPPPLPGRFHATDADAPLRTNSGPQNNDGTRPTQAAGPPVAPELAPIVQNQLEALATQNYVWQGQVWPGQQMDWEITANPDGRGAPDDAVPQRWQTHLKLALPSLGGVEATLRLSAGGQLEITLQADNETTRQSLRLAAPQLNQQLKDAGLSLQNFGISRPVSPDE